MAPSLAPSLSEAQSHQAAGRAREAKRAYASAWELAERAGGSADPLQRAVAALGWAQLALEEPGSWPRLAGKPPDELLLEALEAARSATQRSRSLEGQLLFLRSKALFAKPAKDAECIDGAMHARLEAARLLQEGAVEALAWPLARARQQLAEAKAAAEAPLALGEAELFFLLQGSLGHLKGAEEDFGLLFSYWAMPESEAGAGPRMTVIEFLGQFVEVAGGLGRPVDAQPCGAPCEGGLPEGSSRLEKELVALVSRHGAGAWELKAEELRGLGLEGDLTASGLEACWHELAPRLKKAVEADAPMACGHSCSTCPTRHDCQVHGALKDIEDL